MHFIDYVEGLEVRLDPLGGIGDQVHLFEERQVRAVNGALAAGRPLLVRGEPGTGKSQLARAAASALGRAFVSHVVDSRTESRDLLWQMDSIARMGEAQLLGALRSKAVDEGRQRLDPGNFLRPGPLWWAFHWEDADKQAERTGSPRPAPAQAERAKNGCVVLIDEIDKAEAEVPNGLLEALGSGEMTPPGLGRTIASRAPLPLVVITSNNERTLPDAFMRRCLVIHLRLPPERNALIDLLMRRGRAHFVEADDTILRRSAELLADDRRAAQDATLQPFPGQAEYLDLVRAVLALAPGDLKKQSSALDQVAEFTLKKYVD